MIVFKIKHYCDKRNFWNERSPLQLQGDIKRASEVLPTL